MSMVKKVPKRQCIGCCEMKEKREMIRVVKNAEGEIFLDSTGKKNGRGAYVCPSEACMKQAIKSKGLERAFKVPVPGEIYQRLMEEIKELESE